MASDFRLKESLPELTERIVETYAGDGKINHLGHCPLPKYEVIISAVEDLKDILYPGYRRREGLHIGNVTYHVGDLIDGLHDKLTTQIARALRHEDRLSGGESDCDGPVDYEAEGQKITIQFLESLPRLRAILANRCSGSLRWRSRLQKSGRGDLLLIQGWMPLPCIGWRTNSTNSMSLSFPA